jgi:primosomal protein N' (replication factor Y) (superfamily II helicase)
VNRPAAGSGPAPYASVVLTEPSLSHLGRAFTYRVPEEMPIEVGSVVRVPFRRRNREGVVVELLAEPDVERTLNIKAILGPGLDEDLVGLCRWVAEHYLATLGEALAAAVPERVVEEEGRPRDRAPRGRARSLAWLRRYRNGAAIERALSGSRYAGFSWRPSPDRASEIASLAANTAARGQGVLVLLPEVRFSGETAEALRSLGDAVAWLGSDRGARERYRAWLAVRDGSKAVAVGGRAAVYAPVRDLGLVIVDDEAHVSYKERRAPRINARAVASERARRAGATFIAAGTPPSVEAGAAVERRAMTAVSLTRDAGGRTRPPVTVVDRSGDGARLVPNARTLRLCATELAAGRRVVLLIHRAGDEARRAATRAFRILGPKRPARLDARTDPKKLAEAVLEADCIMATPVIAKDLDIERVGLVAILEADTALSVPEFRGAEEAFATWWHMGPWLRDGRMAIETAQPDHPAIRALVRWDPDVLYRWEASRRRETGYPPFAGLARIDLQPARGPAVASEVSEVPGLSVLGPLERGGKAVVVVRSQSRAALIEGLAPLVDKWRSAGESIRVDVDPREVLP